jgi:hypothetical protein
MSLDPGILSTISALAGTIVGAVSSLTTTWMTTKRNERNALLAAERAKREDLYGRFMDIQAKLYSSALKNEGVDYDRLPEAYALCGRITLYASKPVADAALHSLRYIVDLSIGQKLSDADIRALMDKNEADVINLFAATARAELAALR